MIKNLIIISMLALMLLPGACALSAIQTTIYDGQTVTYDDLSHLDFTVTGMNTALYNYSVTYVMGKSVLQYPKVLDGTYTSAESGDYETVPFTASHVTVQLHREYYPFEQSQQRLVWGILESYKSNGTLHNAILNTTNFNLSATDNPAYTTLGSIEGCDPPNFDLNANRIVDRGLYFYFTGLMQNASGYVYSQIPFTIFLTDNTSNRNILAYGTGNYYYAHNDTFRNEANGVKWVRFTWGKSVFVTNYSKGYFIYIGIPLTGGRTDVNTLMSLPDGTMYSTNFSTNGFTTTSRIYPDDISKTYKYVGACIYFETAPTKTTLGGGLFTIGSIGLMVRNFGTLIGLPSLYLLIALLIVCLFLAIPWRFAIKYDINLPNFIYVILLVGGMTADLSIGLLDFWMYGLFVLTMVLLIIMKYREDIEKAAQPYISYLQTKSLKKIAARPEYSDERARIKRVTALQKKWAQEIGYTYPEYDKINAATTVEQARRIFKKSERKRNN